jgi:hypothetical protein
MESTCTFFLELHCTTQILTTHTHTHPYEHTYVNPISISTSEGLRSADLEIPEVTLGGNTDKYNRLASARTFEGTLVPPDTCATVRSLQISR